MKLHKIVLVSLITCLSLQAAEQPADISFMQRQYKQFRSDLTLVKKCYITRSPGCTDHERIEARGAAKRLTGQAVVLAGLMAALSYGGYKAHGWWNKRNAVLRVQNQNQKPIVVLSPQQSQYQGETDDEKIIIQQLKNNNIDIDKDLVKFINDKSKESVDLLSNLIREYKNNIALIKSNLSKNPNFYNGVSQKVRIETLKQNIHKTEIALKILPLIWEKNKQAQEQQKKIQQEQEKLKNDQEKDRIRNLTDDDYVRKMSNEIIRSLKMYGIKSAISDSDIQDTILISNLSKNDIEKGLNLSSGNLTRVVNEINNFLTRDKDISKDSKDEYDKYFFNFLKYTIAKKIKKRREQRNQ